MLRQSRTQTPVTKNDLPRKLCASTCPKFRSKQRETGGEISEALDTSSKQHLMMAIKEPILTQCTWAQRWAQQQGTGYQGAPEVVETALSRHTLCKFLSVFWKGPQHFAYVSSFCSKNNSVNRSLRIFFPFCILRNGRKRLERLLGG